MKIAYITGCLGFMGAYFTRKCLKRGWMVFGIDKMTYASNPLLLQEFQKYENFIFQNIDIKDMEYLCDCDYVVNFAAESHVGNSIVKSDEFIDTNIIGVKNLLNLIRFKQENCNRRPILFHISTDEVYGDIDTGDHTEEDLLKPSNPYSASKASGDMLILAWARTYGINYIIMRPTNNYGIGQYPEKLIPLSVKNLRRGLNIRLHNNGTPVRNWLHADDTAEAALCVIDSGKINEIYNISGNFEQTNIETVKKVLNKYFGTLDNWEKHVDFSYFREGQDVRYALNDNKLRTLGWEPQKVFDEEIGDIVQYYKNNFIW